MTGPGGSLLNTTVELLVILPVYAPGFGGGGREQEVSKIPLPGPGPGPGPGG